MRWHWYCVAHPLTRRYVFGQFLGQSYDFIENCSVFSASWLGRNGFLNNLRLIVFKVLGLPQLSFESGLCWVSLVQIALIEMSFRLILLLKLSFERLVKQKVLLWLKGRFLCCWFCKWLSLAQIVVKFRFWSASFLYVTYSNSFISTVVYFEFTVKLT